MCLVHIYSSFKTHNTSANCRCQKFSMSQYIKCQIQYASIYKPAFFFLADHASYQLSHRGSIEIINLSLCFFPFTSTFMLWRDLINAQVKFKVQQYGVYVAVVQQVTACTLWGQLQDILKTRRKKEAIWDASHDSLLAVFCLWAGKEQPQRMDVDHVSCMLMSMIQTWQGLILKWSQVFKIPYSP